ncbi:GntR family transcriptional regulator [Salipiger sp. H15]|uniref:GntR family transcriptional regulator n=1 Tax=Alloyangia sp. H15 TaxID=3029062 RepID=A0AAU8AKW8_9RHOB
MRFESIDISLTRSASDIVFEALRRAIVLGEMKHGTPLRQEDIARAFNVSRVPVREAIARLEHLGLVETRRYRGAVVAPLLTQDIEEIFDLRALVESDAIRRAVPLLSPQDLDTAREAHLAFAATSDPVEWIEHNRRFHCALYAADRQKHYIGVVETMLTLSDRYLRSQLLLSDGQKKAVAEHGEILAACEAGDADRAARLVRSHVQEAKTSLLEGLEAR